MDRIWIWILDRVGPLICIYSVIYEIKYKVIGVSLSAFLVIP